MMYGSLWELGIGISDLGVRDWGIVFRVHWRIPGDQLRKVAELASVWTIAGSLSKVWRLRLRRSNVIHHYSSSPTPKSEIRNRPIMKILEHLVDFALPPVCPICERPLAFAGSVPAACEICIARITRVQSYCGRCSAPLGPNLTAWDGCHHCQGERFAFESAIALGEYRDLLRDAILKAKRTGGEAAIAWLVERLWEHRGEDLKGLAIDFVTAVPQHWLRRLSGPHNTAELMGRRVARRLKRPFRASILTKRRRTPRQTELNPTQRRNNLRSVFRAAPSCSGANILLFDDVMTTGTTAHRAARALRDAGAKRVWVAAIARGLGR